MSLEPGTSSVFRSGSDFGLVDKSLFGDIEAVGSNSSKIMAII